MNWISTSILFACVWCRLPRRQQVCTQNQQNTNCTYRLNLLWRASQPFWWFMWRSASESKLVHSRYSRLSQAWRTVEPIRIISAVSNWFRRRTSHKLNSLNSIRLMWSTASEPGLKLTLRRSHDGLVICRTTIQVMRSNLVKSSLGQRTKIIMRTDKATFFHLTFYLFLISGW